MLAIVIEIIVALDADRTDHRSSYSIQQKKTVYKLIYVESKIELGKACGIQVGAAVVAITVIIVFVY